MGDIIVDAAPGAQMEPCTVALYAVTVKPRRVFWGGHSFYVFAGRTRSGQVLGAEECRAIMEFPVLSHTTRGQAYGKVIGI